MISKARAARSFNFHSDRGSIAPHKSCYTSGLVHDESGSYQAVSDDEVIATALRLLSKRMVVTPVLSNPRVVREYLALRFAGLEHEVFACLYLDNRSRVLACEELFRGTIDGASVHPREVVKRVLAHNAAAVIFTHNHPSGVAEPSMTDQLLTQRLKEAMSLVDVRVLDHLVVGGASVESFAERGLL